MPLAETSETTDHSIQKATLLFVDDERRVLTSMRAMFRREYHVFVANSGEEALEVMDREQVDVVISDQRMPKMTGVELLCAIKARSPSVMRVLLTGYADLEAIEASINDGEVFRYLMKPCPPEDLKKAISMAVDASKADGDDQARAELIPFPVERQARNPAQQRKSARRVLSSKASSKAPSPSREVAATTSPDDGVEILVLTQDKPLFESIRTAADTGREVNRVVSVDQAMEALAKRPVGVMVTDMTVDSKELEILTKTLKREVPELVTVIASERSDAQTLISLINEGQIYRFLLKPVSQGQCRLWMTSAVRKFVELSEASGSVARHRVDEQPAASSILLGMVRDGFTRIRARLGRQQTP